MNVVGWIVFALVSLYGGGCIASQSRDPGVRWMMRVKGAALTAFCAASLVLPFSKLWLLVALPVSSILPMVLMNLRARSVVNGTVQSDDDRMMELAIEARRTNVPLAELVRREEERTGRRL